MTTMIDTAKVNNAGNVIIEQSSKMLTVLQEISALVESSKSCFDSEGGESARANFRTSAAKFEEFHSFAKSYGDFLTSHGAAHDSADSQISDIAQKIPKL